MALNESHLTRLQNEYFEGRSIEISKAKESSSRNDYYIVTDGQKKYFLKACRESIAQLDKFDFFVRPVEHLVALVPTKDGASHLMSEGLTFFLQPYIEGRDFDPNNDQIVQLAHILGAINNSFVTQKNIYPRQGYGSLKSIAWSESTQNILQTKYDIRFTQDDYAFVDKLRSLREVLLNKPLYFEHADCHPSNIRVSHDGRSITIIDLDSFCSVPQGTSLGMLIERMASNAQLAQEMYEAYSKAHNLSLNLASVLHLSQLETLQRLNYIFSEIQTTGATNWPNDFKKHLTNLRRIDSYLTELS